jgi:hypothetical protein
LHKVLPKAGLKFPFEKGGFRQQCPARICYEAGSSDLFELRYPHYCCVSQLAGYNIRTGTLDLAWLSPPLKKGDLWGFQEVILNPPTPVVSGKVFAMRQAVGICLNFAMPPI